MSIEFIDGLIIKKPADNAPDFVKFKISIKRKDLGNWLRGKSEDWINIDVKESREGKLYASVDNWVPDKEKVPQNAPTEATREDNGFDDKIPEALGGDIDEDVPFANPYQFCYLCV